jgi:CHAT domain-containing protein/predicted negative regulator of RcsB-dependent stress response
MAQHRRHPAQLLPWLKSPLLAALLVMTQVSLSGATPSGTAALNQPIAQQVPIAQIPSPFPPVQSPIQRPDITPAVWSYIGHGFTLLQLSEMPYSYGKPQEVKEFLQGALNNFNEALQLLQKVENQDLEAKALMGKALTLVKMGDVYINGIGSAIDSYKEALSILREKAVRQASPQGSRSEEANTLRKIAEIHADQGRWEESIQDYNQALLLFQENGDRSSEAITLNNLGQIYTDLGQRDKALNYYEQALPLSRVGGDRTVEAAILSNRGMLYANKQDANKQEWQKSIESLNQALTLLTDGKNRNNRADILNKIGLVYAKQKKWKQALKSYKDALKEFNSEFEQNYGCCVLPGSSYFVEGKDGGEVDLSVPLPSETLDPERLPEQLNEGNGDSRKWRQIQQLPIILNNMDLAYAGLAGVNVRAAEYFYNLALKLSQAVGDKSVEARIHGNLAELYRGQGKLPEALTQINAAIELIEGLRSELRDDSLKASYFASVQDYYQFKVDLLMQLHPQQPQERYDIQALETADQGRARVLRDLLTEARAKITKDIAPQLRQREEDLQFQLARAEKELIRFSSSQEAQAHVQVARIQAQINALLREQDRLKAEIRRESPAYAKLQYPQPMTLAQIQQQLDDHTLLLQYALGDDRSYLWAVSKTSLTSYTLPGRKAIEQAANQFKDVLNAPGTNHLSVTSPAFQSNTVAAATQLSDLILKPVAAQLGNHRLVIVADGALHYVPFAALSLSGQPYTPLVAQHDLVNLPSASTIAILRDTVLKHRQPAPKTVAVLADPVFNQDDARTRKPVQQASQPTRSAIAIASSQENALTIQLNQSFMQQLTRSLQRDGWPRLEGTDTEARAILALVPKAEDKLAAFGFEANYTWITNPQLKQYRHLILATHGIFEPNNPALSGLLLSQFDSQGNPVERGYLRLGDLFNLDLGAELVVLSACQTGLGENLRGEGIVGLTRGLMYAGAPRVVTSLWNVNDKGTAELMQQFYQAILNKGQPPAAALNAAQRAMWQQGKNPYLWAAFTLQGEWR